MPFASASLSAVRLTSSGSSLLSDSSSINLASASLTRHLALLARLLAHRLAHQVGEVDHADLAAHAGDLERRGGWSIDVDLDLLGVEMALAEHLPEALAGGGAGVLAGERVEQPLGRRLARRFLDRLAAALPFEPHRLLDQVAGDLLDVAADIADLGELGRLDLDERRVGELGEAPADLGLAAAGRADHQDVLGRHLLAQLLGQLLAAPAVAQGDRDGALGVVLADDVGIERGDDRLGREFVVHTSCRSRGFDRRLAPGPLAGKEV